MSSSYRHIKEYETEVFPPNAEELETDIVEVTAHSGARPDHAEWQIRKTKRELIAADAVGDKDLYTAKSVKLRKQREEYSKFSEKAGLLPQNVRTSVDGFGRSQAARASWAERKELDKYSKYHYNKDGNIVVTDDWKDKNKPQIPREYKPNAVIETKTEDKNGNVQIDRSFYDDKGLLTKQVHGGNHGKPKLHPYGQHGEHRHSYIWIEGQDHPNRDTDELTNFDRKENSDII